MNHTINFTDDQIRSLISTAKVDLNVAEMCLPTNPDDAATSLRMAAGYINIAAVLLTRAMEERK